MLEWPSTMEVISYIGKRNEGFGHLGISFTCKGTVSTISPSYDGIDLTYKSPKLIEKVIPTRTDKCRLAWGKHIANQQPILSLKDMSSNAVPNDSIGLNACIDHLTLNINKAMEFAGIGTLKTLESIRKLKNNNLTLQKRYNTTLTTPALHKTGHKMNHARFRWIAARNTNQPMNTQHPLLMLFRKASRQRNNLKSTIIKEQARLDWDNWNTTMLEDPQASWKKINKYFCPPNSNNNPIDGISWIKHFNNLYNIGFIKGTKNIDVAVSEDKWNEIYKGKINRSVLSETNPVPNDEITVDEIVAAIRKIKVNSSSGFDGISAKWLKNLLRTGELNDVLFTIFNKNYETRQIPDA